MSIGHKVNKIKIKEVLTIENHVPKTSPWGEIQVCKEMVLGVFFVDTPSHGGIMVDINYANIILSEDAQRYGEKHNNYLCYEEDTQANIVEYELLSKKLWNTPEYVSDKEKYIENLKTSLNTYNPEYMRLQENEKFVSDNNKRYVVHNSLSGAILIDKETKTISSFNDNICGQIYNLKNPDILQIDQRKINGLIKRTKQDSYYNNSKFVDGFMFEYLMSVQQQLLCKRYPDIYYSEKIIETNDLKTAIKTMCEWVYERSLVGGKTNKENRKEENLKYCYEYIKNEIPEKQTNSIYKNLKEKAKDIKPPVSSRSTKQQKVNER